MKNFKHVFGVDVDGVLADLVCILKKTAEEILEMPFGSLPQPKSFDLEKEWNVPYSDVFVEAVLRNDIFTHCPTIDGSAETLSAMKQGGWHIRIITHRGAYPTEWLDRLGRNQRWLKEETLHWLEYNEIPYDDIFCAADKTSVHADLYIDDQPNIITAYEKAGQNALLFRRSYNNAFEPASGLSVRKWSEVPAIAAEYANRQ